MDLNGLIDVTQIVPFINKGTSSVPQWIQIKKGTSFSLALNPEIKEFKFISSKTSQEEVTGYKPNLPQSLVMFKGEDDYEFFFNLLFHLPIGSKAHKEALLVFYQEKGKDSDAKDVYKAWITDCVIKLNQLDASNNQSIDFDMAFNSVIQGAVSLETGSPVFTKGSWEQSSNVFTADI